MADNPPPALLIEEAQRALDAGAAPGFAQKVAANAMAIAQRELDNGEPVSAVEAARLSAAIRAGHIDDALVGELIRITIAKLEIDQPTYPGFAAWKNQPETGGRDRD